MLYRFLTEFLYQYCIEVAKKKVIYNINFYKRFVLFFIHKTIQEDLLRQNKLCNKWLNYAHNLIKSTFYEYKSISKDFKNNFKYH